MPVTTEDFQRALQGRFRKAESKGEQWLVVRAGDLHQAVKAAKPNADVLWSNGCCDGAR